MKKLRYVMTVCGYLIVSYCCMEAANVPIDANIGIERVAAHSRLYAFRCDMPGVNNVPVTTYNFGVYNQNVIQGSFRSVAQNEYPLPTDLVPAGVQQRTFADDIRRAQIDFDTFENFLEQSQYGEAFRMCHPDLEHPQGILWRRRVIACAKKELTALVEQGVLRDKKHMIKRSYNIVNQFRRLIPTHAFNDAFTQLREVHQTAYTNARAERDRFFADPVIRDCLDDMRGDLVDCLFGTP
jgi:hypothetical protein